MALHARCHRLSGVAWAQGLSEQALSALVSSGLVSSRLAAWGLPLSEQAVWAPRGAALQRVAAQVARSPSPRRAASAPALSLPAPFPLAPSVFLRRRAPSFLSESRSWSVTSFPRHRRASA